jgi:flagellin
MAAVINTNIPSLNTQRNLNSSQSSLNTSIQRLSSGLRVNSAKDDAAGLAIADRMNTQIKGLAVAQRNANDGISLAQTAEGALSTVGDNLQRMRELAVQLPTAPTAPRPQDLNDEYTQLSQEVFRVLNGTSFNGQNLFTGVGQGIGWRLHRGQRVGFPDPVVPGRRQRQDNKLNDQITITLDDLSNNSTIATVIGTSAKGLIGLGDTSGVSTAQATYTSAKAALDNLFATGSSLSASALASSAVTLQAAVDSAKLALDQLLQPVRPERCSEGHPEPGQGHQPDLLQACRVRCRAEPLQRGHQQPASVEREHHRVPQPYHGYRLRAGNREPDPCADPATSWYRDAVAGQLGAAAGPLAVEISQIARMTCGDSLILRTFL